MAERLSVDAALRILGVTSTAELSQIRQRYHRLAREHHPDTGGDERAFLRLKTAYEVVRGEYGDRAVGIRRASTAPATSGTGIEATWRTRARTWDDDPVALDAVDWDLTLPDAGATMRLDRDALAVLASRSVPGPVNEVTGRSRGPRSRLNRHAATLSDDLTSSWRIAVAQDRGAVGHDVELRVVFRQAGARRRARSTSFPAGWTWRRGTTTITARRLLTPSRDRRATALRSADAMVEVLEHLRWPLSSWYGLAP